jgi:hypothetical protein
MDYLSISENDLQGSNFKLQETLKSNIKLKAYEFLMDKAKQHSKVNQNIYQNCDGCSHYEDERFSTEIINNLFKFRTRTFLVKNNFRNNYRNSDILCPLCNRENDTQEHIFYCPSIIDQYGKPCLYQYNDIFSMENDTLLGVSRELKDLVDIRDKILHPDDKN